MDHITYKAKTFCCHMNSAFVLFCFSILRIRSNLSFFLLPLMMLLLQPFVFLNPIRLDCLTIVNKSCHSATISRLPRGKGKCGAPSKANKKQHCTWKWRQSLLTTTITFNYNRLQKKVVGLQRSPIAGSTIIYSSYNYQKSKTKQLAFNRREKKQHANGEVYRFIQRTSQLRPWKEAKHTTAHKCNLVSRGRPSLLLFSCLVRGVGGELPRAGGESGVKGGAPERGEERAWKGQDTVTTPPQHTVQERPAPPLPSAQAQLTHQLYVHACVIITYQHTLAVCMHALLLLISTHRLCACARYYYLSAHTGCVCYYLSAHTSCVRALLLLISTHQLCACMLLLLISTHQLCVLLLLISTHQLCVLLVLISTHQLCACVRYYYLSAHTGCVHACYYYLSAHTGCVHACVIITYQHTPAVCMCVLLLLISTHRLCACAHYYYLSAWWKQVPVGCTAGVVLGIRQAGMRTLASYKGNWTAFEQTPFFSVS